MKREHGRFISDHFDDDQLVQIKRIMNFQQKKNDFKLNKSRLKIISLKEDEEKMLNEIEKLLNKKEVENKFWDLETDEVFNFRYYY